MKNYGAEFVFVYWSDINALRIPDTEDDSEICIFDLNKFADDWFFLVNVKWWENNPVIIPLLLFDYGSSKQVEFNKFKGDTGRRCTPKAV